MMKKNLLSAARKVFSPPQRAALRHIATELQIWYYHRKGLWEIRQRSLSKPSKINLGSGPARKHGYLNIDLFPGADLTLDLREGLPFESNCCEIIFSEHFFEHIDYPEPARHLFSECFRVLQPGGILRFSVPDTEWPLHDYRDGSKAPYFLACNENPWGHPSYCITRLEHINYHFRQDGQHLFAYDEETVRKLLEPLGFSEITRDSFDPQLDSEHRRIGSLFISARKPT
jgi:predicted SAM-dependent methyltransferase